MSSSITSLAVIAGGFPLTVRIGGGFGMGVGVKGMRVGVAVGVVPSKRRFPIGVNVRIGTRMMVLIEMNNRAIAIVRRIIYAPGWGKPHPSHIRNLNSNHGRDGACPVLVPLAPPCLERSALILHSLRPAGVIISHTLKGVGDTQDNFFSKEFA